MVKHSDLVVRIADKADCLADEVEQAFQDHGVALSVTHRNPRQLTVHRLRICGEKTSKVEPGEFDKTFTFPLGVTVISAGNLRGKSSIIQIIEFALRGAPRELQPDTLSWLSKVSLDVCINGSFLGFRLDVVNGEVAHGRILSGPLSDLQANDIAGTGVAVIREAGDPDEWAETVAAFMLERLSLDEIIAFNKGKSEADSGTIKSHGWPMYFSTLFPPSGAEKILLGNTVADNLPVRLLQVFLDQPDAIRTARVGALARKMKSEHVALDTKRKTAERGLSERLATATERLNGAEKRLALIKQASPEDDLATLGRKAVELGATYTRLRATADGIRDTKASAKSARISDERALLDLTENAAAQKLFHGLDPAACPRCETTISPLRKQREVDGHQCAVCDNPLDAPNDEELTDLKEQFEAALRASSAAETALSDALVLAEANLHAATLDLEEIDRRIVAAGSARTANSHANAELDVASAKAVFETLQSISGDAPEPPINQRIFEAAEMILKEEIKKSGKPLYDDLDEEILRLARNFGFAELEHVRLKPQQLHMDVTKGGGKPTSFSSQSPGERLRLRYALLMSLLSVARKHQVAGHPGLLLLDSLKAEEVQQDHAKTLLRGLVQAADEEPGLQILVTTEDRELAASVPGISASISPAAGHTSLF